MGKRDLSEEDIKAQYITPAIEKAGWDIKSKCGLSTLLQQGGLFFEEV